MDKINQNVKNATDLNSKILQSKNIKNLATSILYYNSISIFIPLIIFTGLGILLDKHLHSKPYLTISGLIIAFTSTNILMFRKMRILNKKIQKQKLLKPNTNSDKNLNKTEAK